MASSIPTRQEAWELLRQYNQSDKAIRHALAVEAVMRHAAARRGQEVEMWGIVGLVHDLDYEQFPQQHCQKVQEILRQRNWPEDYIRAIVSHGWGICSDVEPQTDLEKVLYAVDELCGLVAAAALVRPSKSILDLEVRSVKKKWKEKGFAAGVDRSVIERGARGLGMELDQLIAEVIEALRPVAGSIGLAGAGA